MNNPIDLISAERERQTSHWSESHDDTHQFHELALLASVFAMPCSHRYPALVAHLCPWPDVSFPDPKTEEERDRELVKAGALIVAELERRQRARRANTTVSGPKAPL